MRNCLIAFALAAMAAPAGAEHSKLWGRSGEKWSPQSRLPDFSYAGYRYGEKPIPKRAGGVSVKRYGAKGDGKADDTAAFKKAIDAARGVILIPPGRYKITDILYIKKSGVVLRGAGPDKTTLYFPKVLNDVKENWGSTTSGRKTSNYSWSGGYLWVRGSFRSRGLAKITRPAKRGDTRITVSSASGIRPGQEIEIYQRDTSRNSLAVHLYAGQAGDVKNIKGRTRASLVTRVKAARGTTITIERPLRFDIRAEWQPEVRRFDPSVTEVGIEEMRFAFPAPPYKGHFTELGHNPIALSGCAHCWVRNIEVFNGDSGPYVSGKFCTIDGIVLDGKRKTDRGGLVGHHGVSLTGDDNLLTNFDFKVRFVHDITYSHCAGNVTKNGKGVDMSFDHHRRAPYANLFTNIDVGKGGRMYRCGGGRALGVHCGAWGTFWNIRARQPQKHPGSKFGPDAMNFVGVFTRDKSVTNEKGRWWEAIDPKRIEPKDLHAAQLARRLQRRR